MRCDMRIAIISNRLPVTLQRNDQGLQIQRGPGGLVTALNPILRARGGLWIGWPGPVDAPLADVQEALQGYGRQAGYSLFAVQLSRDDVHGFYQGFCNEIIWPLFWKRARTAI